VTGTSACERPLAAGGPRSLGILGGTFNPPHLGHLVVARHARAQLGLERVLLMPAHTPPHKPRGEDPGPQHRLRMCALLAAAEAWLSASALEIERGGRSYTVDTLQALHNEHPDAEITFIAGADIASTLAGWHQPVRLLELARLAVAARSGSARMQVLDAVTELAGDESAGRAAAAEVSFLEMGEVEVSSSMVRERVARGEDIEELVGAGVAAYIAANGLYRSPSASGA